MADEFRRENAHESRQHHEPRRVTVDGIHERGVEVLPARIRFVIHHLGFDGGAARAFEPRGVWAIADNGAQRVRAVRILRIVDDCLQVGAAPGDEHHDRATRVAHA